MRLESAPPVAVDLSALLHGWIALGVLGLICLPFAAWQNLYVGWLPYWLVVAPAISLALLHRHRLDAVLRSPLRVRRRRAGALRITRARRVPVPPRLRHPIAPARRPSHSPKRALIQSRP